MAAACERLNVCTYGALVADDLRSKISFQVQESSPPESREGRTDGQASTLDGDPLFGLLARHLQHLELNDVDFVSELKGTIDADDRTNQRH